MKDMLLDILYGLKPMAKAIGLCMLVAAVVWGIVSGLWTIFGEIDFSWWNLPCWILVVAVIAGCFGQDR